MPIHRTQEESVAVLTLELGRSNAINGAFIEEVNGALDALEGDAGVKAVVVTGQGKIFCVGLDLVETTALEADALAQFVDAFDAMFLRLATFPKPVVAAINGHAIAGGCLLAMSADYRVMAAGKARIGVNEAALGLSLPSASFEVARRGIPAASWTEALFEGRLFEAEEALKAGLVHKLAASDVVAEAVEVGKRLSAGSPKAVRVLKADLVAPLVASVTAHREERRARFLGCWNSAEAQARIGKVREQLVRKPAGQ
ncbi:enoyl-CoA hydratase/isomerase family protein [Chondromyces apiculatus]|nr:enoyl-CoA hydratase/isomerase family protein [Chondromyces apiculatus]